MDSTAAFHGIMMLLLVPMWMVSGALFPMATAHGAVKALMWGNPVTYSVALLNHTLGLPNADPGAAQGLLVTVLFGIALLRAACWRARRPPAPRHEASDGCFAALCWQGA